MAEGVWQANTAERANWTHEELGFPRFLQYTQSGACSSASVVSAVAAAGGIGRSKARPYLLELKPGETLYIPPYWARRVEGLEPLSVSISGLTRSSEEEAIRSLVHDTPLPFDGAWPGGRLTSRAIVKYFELVSV